MSVCCVLVTLKQLPGKSVLTWNLHKGAWSSLGEGRGLTLEFCLLKCGLSEGAWPNNPVS